MNSYRVGEAEAESEGSGGRLGKDGRWADLRSFSPRVCGRFCSISTFIGAVTNAKGRRFHVVSVRVLGHGGLGVLYTIAQELVVLVEVDGEVTRS